MHPAYQSNECCARVCCLQTVCISYIIYANIHNDWGCHVTVLCAHVTCIDYKVKLTWIPNHIWRHWHFSSFELDQLEAVLIYVIHSTCIKSYSNCKKTIIAKIRCIKFLLIFSGQVQVNLPSVAAVTKQLWIWFRGVAELITESWTS